MKPLRSIRNNNEGVSIAQHHQQLKKMNTDDWTNLVRKHIGAQKALGFTRKAAEHEILRQIHGEKAHKEYVGKLKEEYGAGEFGTPELTNRLKSETPGQEVEEDLKGACWKGYEAIGTKKKNGRTVPNCVPKESAVDSPPAIDASQRPVGKGWGEQKVNNDKPISEENISESGARHFKVVGQVRNADGSLGSITHKIKYVRDAEHAKDIASRSANEKGHKDYKAIRATEVNEEYGAGFEGTPELTNKFKNQTPGQEVDEEGHDEEITKHHDAAQAAKKAGDNDKFHYHMDQKFASMQKKERENAKAPVKTFESSEVNEARTADSYSTEANAKSWDAHKGKSAMLHSTAALAHKEASAAHSRKIDSLMNKPDAHDAIAHHEQQVKKHDSAAQTHSFMAHRFRKQSEVKKPVSEATYIVGATVSNPNHQMVSEHSDTKLRKVKLKANSEEHALEKAKDFYKNKGYHVHEVFHHSELLESTEDINLRITKHEKQAVEAAKKGDKSEQQYHLYQVKRLKGLEKSKNVKEEVNEPGEDDTAGMSSEDIQEMKRLAMLVRLGLMDRQKLPIIQRAMKKLMSETPVTNVAEKQVLFELLESLIAIVTGDNAVFNKIRFNVTQHNS